MVPLEPVVVPKVRRPGPPRHRDGDSGPTQRRIGRRGAYDGAVRDTSGGRTMAGITLGSFDRPDELRTPDRTRVEVVRVAGQTVARFTFQPGWRWSTSVKPVVGTESCQARHV